MANIANIDFKVILDDKEFNKTVKAVEDKAKQLNTDLSNLLKITGSGPDLKSLQEANQALQARLDIEKKLNRAMDTRGKKEQAITDAVNARNAATVNFNTNIDKQIISTNNNLEKQSKLMNKLKGLAASYFSIAGAERLISSLVRITGEFEIQRTTLRAILQDVSGADSIFEQMKSLAVVSPFGFKELVSYAKQLSAYSIPMSELYDTTKMLADVSAGLGVDMSRIVLAYGQIRSASFLRGTEVRQLTEAGIPILEELRQQFIALGEEGTTVGDVFDKISKRLVPFEMVAKAFKDMTSEGGKFYQMQEIQATTLQGKISNLKDAYEIMMNDIGERFSPVMKKSVDALRELLENWDKIGRTLLSAIATYGIVRVELELLPVLLGRATFATTAFGKALARVKALALANPYTAIAVGAAALAAVMYTLVNQQSSYERSLEAVNNAVSRYNAETSAEAANLRVLIAQLEGAEKGTKAYDLAKKQILSTYGDYMSDLDKENLEVGKLTDVYNRLTVAIREMHREKALQEGMSDITAEYTKQYNNLYKEFNRSMEQIGKGFEKAEINSVWKYIIGDVNEEQLSDNAWKIIKKTKELVDARNSASAGTYFGYFGRSVEDMKKDLDNYNVIMEDAAEDLRNKIGNPLLPKAEDVQEELKAWQSKLEAINNEASKKGIRTGIKITRESDLMEVSKAIKNAYDTDAKEAEKARLNDKELYDTLTARLEVYREMDRAINGVALTDSKVTKKANDAEVDRLEARGKALSKLMDWYDKLQDLGFNDSTIRDLLAAWMPSEKDAIAAGNYADQIRAVAESLKAYGDAGKRAAEQLEQGLGKDGMTDFLKSYEAIDKFRTKIQSWLDRDYNLEGSDVNFKISNILARMTAQNSAIDTEYSELAKLFEKATSDAEALKVIRETYGEEAWTSYLEDGTEAIEELARREKENNKKTAQEKINDLYKAYVEQQLLDQNIDTTKWSEKSIDEIRRIKEALANMMTEGLGELPYETQYNLLAAGISLEKFEEMYKQILGLKYNDADDQYWKRLIKNMNEAFDAASDLAGVMDSLGEGANIPILRDMNKLVGYATNVAKAFTGSEEALKKIRDIQTAIANDDQAAADKMTKELMKSGDFYAMILKVVVAVGEGIVSGIVANYEQQKALNEAMIEYRETMNDIARENYKNIFGTNEIGLLAENYKIATDNFKEFSDTLSHTGNHNWFLQTGVEIASLEELAKRYPEVFDELGNVNMEYIKSMRDIWDAQGWGFWSAKNDDGSYVTQSLMDDIDELIAKYDAMEDANDELMSSFESLFGSLVDDVVDNLLESFDEMGDAVANLDSIFENLGETILSSLLKTYIMENVLNKYEDRFKKMMTDYATSARGEDAALQLAEAAGNLADNVKNDIAGFGGAINVIITAFKDSGLYGGEEASDSSVASGIKGITEDTANLLASYLNAMRADLSFMRGKQSSYIDYMMVTMPTLATHIANLDARAYDIALSNAEIAENTANTLADLRSVIGSTSGMTAIRVESV